MVLARQVAADLDDGALKNQPGAYLLGATTPDIRVITRQDRLSTHFFDLDEHSHQDSVGSFFLQHAHLTDPGALNEETRAFVSGYVSHLILDEQYITGVYRPFFAAHERLGGRTRANVMDRLLQFDLERSHYSDPELKRHVCAALGCSVENIQAGFVEPETLERWRQVSSDIASRNMDWDRVRGMITNHLRFSGITEGEELDAFLNSLPELLDATMAHVTSAEVQAFLDRSTAAARTAVARYLACE